MNRPALTSPPNLAHALAIQGGVVMAEVGRVICRSKCSCGSRRWELIEARPRFFHCKSCGEGVSVQATIRIGWQGKKLYITTNKSGTRFPSVDHAWAELESIRLAVDQGEFYPEDYRGRESELFWPNWLDARAAQEAKSRKPSTLRKYQALWKHLRPAFKLNIKEIRTGHIEDWISGLDFSPKYKADLLGELKRLFRVAIARGEMGQHPALPRIKVPQKPIRYLSPRQQGEALNQIPEIHQPVFIFLMDHGIRVAEACALCWDMVDFDNEAFWLARTFSDRKLADQTKGNQAVALPILDQDLEAFRESARYYLDAGIIPRGRLPVFRNWEPAKNNAAARNPDRFYTPDRLNTIWRKALQDAGMDHIRLYNATRHSKVMWLKNVKGLSDDQIADAIGHLTGGQHIRKYGRATVETKRRTLAKPTLIKPAVSKGEDPEKC